jgi:SAM-dependent methyltransferase
MLTSDPDALTTREVPDSTGRNDKGPQAALLRATDRSRIREFALADEMLLPATVDREGYLGDDHLGYWLLGLGDALWLREVAQERGVALGPGARILDFGCATGRVLRQFAFLTPGAELRGIEISTTYIAWSRQNLPSSVWITQGTVIPSLPFPDAHFDLIYAGSVFTHIDEFEEAWLLELRRVMKPTGVAVLTIHPGRLWNEMVSDPNQFLRTKVLSTRTKMDPPGTNPITDADFAGDLPGPRVVFTNLNWPINNLDTIHSHEWVRDRWGQIFDVVDIVEHAHGNHQDAMIGAAL